MKSSEWGCVSTILVVLAVWALLFGVTINGKHYGVHGCSEERGLEVDW